MATQSTASENFYKQLGRMYGTYTGGCIAFIILLAILEQVGTPNKVLGYLFVFFTLAVYAVIGVMTRTAQVSEYYVKAGACRLFITAWRPAPTGCRRRLSSAWPARCSCLAMTASLGCWDGPVASCWCRS